MDQQRREEAIPMMAVSSFYAPIESAKVQFFSIHFPVERTSAWL
jgi:hypothetical protein